MSQWGGRSQADAAAAFWPHEYDAAGKAVGEALLQRKIRRCAERPRDEEELRIGRRLAAVRFQEGGNSAGKIGGEAGPEQIAACQFQGQTIQAHVVVNGTGRAPGI